MINIGSIVLAHFSMVRKQASSSNGPVKTVIIYSIRSATKFFPFVDTIVLARQMLPLQ